MARRPSRLKIIPLGGLGEIGKNLTVVEYRDDIVIVDCGMTFPDEDMPGVDIVIPDFTYLEQNQHRVRGIVLTHGHEDHIGAIPYLLKKMPLPVYGTRLTLGILENKMKEHNLDLRALKVVRHGDRIKLGTITAEFIAVSHSIPDASAIALHTSMGTVIVTGDFKIDYTPIDGCLTDLPRLAELGSKGVLALLADSTNVERKGHTLSERTVGDKFIELFGQAKGRIVVATFASNLHRIQQVIYAAEHYGRKVVVNGRSMVNNIAVALEHNYLKVKKNTIIDLDQANRYGDDLVFLTTGSQGEPMAALSRMAAGEHRKIQLNASDTVIISATPIPGNEKSVSQVINNLSEIGCNVIYSAMEDIHVSGHACQEELKLIHTLVRPKFFIPAHGEARHLRIHARLAQDLGMKEENVYVGQIGDVIELTRNTMRVTGSVPAGNVLVDGLGVGDVGNIVLRDRRVLQEDGLIVVVVTLSKDGRQIVAGPEIISRGFVYVKESGELMDGAMKVVKRALENCKKRKTFDWTTIKYQIKEALRSYIFSEMKRSPMILPVLLQATESDK